MAKRSAGRGSRSATGRRELRTLIEISRVVGTDPDLVQGGGGNASVKTRDGRTMFVKASGTALAEMDDERGWAALDLEAVLALGRQRALLELEADERESRVLHGLLASVRAPLGARPTVESSLHAVLDRVVIHTHPVHLNALLCGRDSREECLRLARRIDRHPLYVKYVDPGFVLGAYLEDEIERHAAEHGEKPSIVLLENHGLFVSRPDAESCVEIHRRVTEAARRKVLGGKRVNPLVFDLAAGSEMNPKRGRGRATATAATAAGVQAELRGALLRAGAAPGMVRRDDTELAARFAASRSAVQLARKGSFTPDQIVYCKTYPLVLGGTSPATWESAIERYREKHGVDPRVFIRPGDGVYYASPRAGELRVISEVYRSAMAAVLHQGSSSRFLSRRQAGFIEDWEIEAFRASVMGGAARRLTGRVALVTGAASGLGKGIALGLAREGAIIVGCDINADMLEAVRPEYPAGQFVPVACDVTSEESVAAAFRRVEETVGGLDILVNGAGIAPAFALVDFPVGAFQKTLDINLTGYFLCAREAARLLLRQDAGGSIVNVTSKSGLEASKANSAYNATKAGEIHLMRGWALELGPAGIRVNCIAPGNVFRGSQIWNPSYIRAAAKKKGIRPEEVIPYYTSLSPLQQEILPEDIAAGVVFLVSDEGAKVTGQTLVVDGGQVMVR